MSERLCQFFLRGRCQREKCEFRHPADMVVKNKDEALGPPAAPLAKLLPPVTIPEKKSSGFESDEDVKGDSDNESIASGFTEKPKVPEKKVANELASPQTKVPPTDAAQTPAAEVTTHRDASSFIAEVAMDITKTGTPVLSRKVAKTTTAHAAEAGEEAKAAGGGAEQKKIRRNSKGFEIFDDYFSDSEGETSAKEKSPEKNHVDQNDSVVILNNSESKDADETNATTEPEKTAASPEKTIVVAKKSVPPPPPEPTVKSTNGEKSSSGEGKKKSGKVEAEKKKGGGDVVQTTIADLSKDWDDDDNDSTAAEETIESIVNFIQDDNAGGNDVTASQESGQKEASATAESGPGGEAVEGAKTNNEWVSFVFGEDGKQIPHEKSVYDLDPDEEDHASGGKAKNFKSAKSQKRKTNLAKKEGVTKIGNNMYFYTGAKDQEESTEEDEEEELEEEDDDDEEWNEEADPETTPISKRGGRSYAHGRRKHNTNYVYGAKSTAAKTRRCGECEGCNREDCAECPACLDKPKFGGKGAKKQACIHRVCSWKNPGGKKGSGATPRTPGTSGRGRGRPPGRPTPVVGEKATTSPEVGKPPAGDQTPVTQAGQLKKRRTISVISPAAVKERPNDKELPTFDPKHFKPGYVPPVVKKGDAEYHIIVSGVKDTGLCGKYWSDIETLPTKRSRKSLAQESELQELSFQTPPPPSPTPKRTRRTESPMPQAQEPLTPAAPKPSAPPATPSADVVAEAPVAQPSVEKSRKRRPGHDDTTPTKKKKSPAKSLTNGVAPASKEVPAAPKEVLSNQPEVAPASTLNKRVTHIQETEPAATPSEPSSSGTANRSVTCVSDTNSQKEVVVECFAPYDDHRWVNIGKEKDGMAPDSVQYARALRPPYHLLSFLRIKGNSTKGMSCTDKNTMVFVVLEGEISVILHTTEFNAKKGDSFYIPPKNYYNLLNKKSREAELSLIQFQYDGPLPTIPAGSQSGTPKPPAAVTSSK